MFAQLPLLASAEFLAVFSAAAIAAANLANHDVVSTVSPASGGSTASSAAGFSSLSQAARGWLQSAVGSMQALGGARPGLGAAGSLFERLSSSKFCALDALGAAAPAGPESTRTMQEESRRMWLEEAIDVSAWVSSPVVAAIRAAATTASAAAFPVSRALTDDDRRQAARFSREPKPSSMVWEREFVCQR
ncbi:hypothetical protein DFJ73DRAFT_822174 [Zopfochytrium polystomum]|nr:hypothetical protein DFJ73DRAFT_822174 [Zopfochytrium polystomum]